MDELKIPLLFWYNSDVSLAIPYASINKLQHELDMDYMKTNISK